MMNKFDPKLLKIVGSGSALTYIVVIGIFLSLGILNFLDSIPLLSQALQIAGLVWFFQNRKFVTENFKKIALPTIEKIKELPGINDEDGE